MELRAADILFKDRSAGTLIETANGGTRFAYATDWQQDIACCLPATRREHEWASGLHPFFEHLGPEGWLREQQARAAHIADEDDLGLLLRYGEDCTGAVSIRPQGKPLAGAAFTEVMASPGRTVSGVQRKLLVAAGTKGIFRPADAEGPAPFIAKFNSALLNTLVRNEALSLRWLTKVLGSKEVNAFQLAQVGDEIALVVTRFDRGPGGEKLRLEDCAQILCKPRGRDFGGKYDAAYEDIAAIIQSHSARPLIDIDQFFRRLIAFALIGNCDAHLKNFSLLETAHGLRLSPAYDVLNTAIYPGYDQTLALSLGGRKLALDAMTGDVLRAFGLAIGLPARAVEKSFTDLRRQVRNAAAIVAPPLAEPPDGFVTRFAEIVSNACLRILVE